jgi:hypothetical protein
MRGIAAFVIVMLLAACGDSSDLHPALEVKDTPTGTYALAAALVKNTCAAEGDGDVGGMLTGRLQVHPRADLGPGVYYLRFEMFDWWTPNFVEVPFEDGAFRASAVSPISISRPDIATIEGIQEKGRLVFTYRDDVSAVGSPGQEGYQPACQLLWEMEAVRESGPVYEAVFEFEEQDCYEDMGVYAHGFVLEVGPSEAAPGATRFFFDSGNWWETFDPVEIGADGAFSFSREEPFFYWSSHVLTFSGRLRDGRLEAGYLEDRRESAPEQVEQTGSYPDCRIAWKVQARIVE